jgi:DNA polymerase-1
MVREATRAFGLPAAEVEGFEADDLIAAYAKVAREAGEEVLVVSSDKDLMQLVGPGVAMWDPMKQKAIGPRRWSRSSGSGRSWCATPWR